MEPDPKRDILNDPHFIVIDETDDYIVVDKPAPLLVHPSVPGNPPTLLDGLEGLLAYEIANGARLSIINRLDRETSGIVLIAKNYETARKFSVMMQRREVEKEYLALVRGWPKNNTFTVDAPIRRKGEVEESPIWVKQIVHPEGAESDTSFSVEKTFTRPDGEKFALVRAFPRTGRMHQIRVHLAFAGHPVVGDKIYGPDETCYLDFIVTGWTPDLEKRLILPRQALHSCKMALGEYCWETGMPRVFEEFMDR
jgi:23S rRNA pseudouridine1911/1915/1917 synthase